MRTSPLRNAVARLAHHLQTSPTIRPSSTLIDLIPWRIRKYSRARHREWVFRRGLKTFASNPEKCLEGDAAILDRLNYGWNNEDWSGSREHLRACLRLALRTSGPILECGSGLSTILLGIVCDGPPGETKGGRYGMMPVMRSRLKPGAWVLLDDAEREDERAIAARWAEECRASYETRGENRRFVEMTMPSASRHTGPDIETSP